MEKEKKQNKEKKLKKIKREKEKELEINLRKKGPLSISLNYLITLLNTKVLLLNSRKRIK